MNPFLYSVTFKRVSNQPDIPWGVIKHQGTLDECHDTNLRYLDGIDLVDFPPSVELRRLGGKECAKSVEWRHPDENHAAVLKLETHPDLKDKTLDQLRIALDAVTDLWRKDFCVPYVQGLLDAEEEKLKDNAALAAANEDDDD